MTQTYGEIMKEKFENDLEMRKYKKLIWSLQSKIQTINLERSKLSAELQQLKIKVEERKIQIRQEMIR